MALNLKLFEAPGGLLTSTQTTGNQWDAPFGWAPLQMIAVEGLRRYGYREDADRVARKFIALVAPIQDKVAGDIKAVPLLETIRSQKK